MRAPAGLGAVPNLAAMDFMRVAGAQLNLEVGNIDGNRDRIVDAMAWAEDVQADVLMLPELAVTGYPPEDLLLRETFVSANLAALEHIAARSEDVVTIVGFVDRAGGAADDAGHRRLANAAALVTGGAVKGVYHKALLPNYGVFDEDRYFTPGTRCERTWSIGGAPVGVSVCEDIWLPDGPPADQARNGARILLNINASPYHRGKGGEREEMLATRAAASRVALAYLNLVGGQDELVFDGESMVFAASGKLLYRAPQFVEQLFWVDVPLPPPEPGAAPAAIVSTQPLLEGPPEPPPPPAEPLEEEAEVYTALVTGLGDYVRKNGFREVVVALSGGIDSALTATIAADALGPERVWGVTMPTRYSSSGSVDDSQDLAHRLGIRFDVLPIDGVFASFLEALDPVFAGLEHDTAEENLQARIRGAITMALSNKFGGIVLATGNKSELAVGYATLYGDMAGGYAVLKDVFKTYLYRLALWRNRRSEVIPTAIIDKPPSAELRPGQQDTDSLPPYDVLDPILERYVEWDWSVAQIVAAGFDPAITREVARMVDRNEYKRRQAAPGVKITTKAFGKDRRLPITNRFRDDR